GSGSDGVFVFDSRLGMSPTAIAATIEGLNSAPWVRIRSATQAMTILPPEGATLPFPTFARGDQSYLSAARAARSALSTLDSILVQPLANADEYDRNVLAAESSEWRSDPASGVRLARRV